MSESEKGEGALPDDSRYHPLGPLTGEFSALDLQARRQQTNTSPFHPITKLAKHLASPPLVRGTRSAVRRLFSEGRLLSSSITLPFSKFNSGRDLKNSTSPYLYHSLLSRHLSLIPQWTFGSSPHISRADNMTTNKFCNFVLHVFRDTNIVQSSSCPFCLGGGQL